MYYLVNVKSLICGEKLIDLTIYFMEFCYLILLYGKVLEAMADVKITIFIYLF